MRSRTFCRFRALAGAVISMMVLIIGGCGPSNSARSPALDAASVESSLNMSQNPKAGSFTMGVGTHIFSSDPDKNVEMIVALGMDSIRDDLQWSGIENAKGTLAIPERFSQYIDILAQNDINPLIILDYGNQFYDSGGKPHTADGLAGFVNYARFSANTLAGKTGFFEIWNEWDHSAPPNTPESYLEVVKAVAPIVRGINSNTVILAGAATSDAMKYGWVSSLVQLGALNYVDGISIHPYLHCDADDRPERLIQNLTIFSSTLRELNQGQDVPLYITEIGWPTSTKSCGNSTELIAKYVARTMLLIRTIPSIRGLWWYDLKNDGEDPAEREHNFGLLNYDYTIKPAYNTLKDTAAVVKNGSSFLRSAPQQGIVMIEIGDSSGGKSYGIWTSNGKTAQVKLSIRRNGSGAIYKLLVGTGIREDLHGDATEITITDNPCLLYGAKNVAVDEVLWK